MLQELRKSGTFEGQADTLIFSHDLEKLNDGLYRTAGQLIAMCISQYGPGLETLHPTLYKLMTGVTLEAEELAKWTVSW